MKRFIVAALAALSLFTGRPAEATTWTVPASCDSCLVTRASNVAAGDTLSIGAGTFTVAPVIAASDPAAAGILVVGTQATATNGVVYNQTFLPAIELLAPANITYKNLSVSSMAVSPTDSTNALNTVFDHMDFPNGVVVTTGNVTYRNCTIGGRIQIYATGIGDINCVVTGGPALIKNINFSNNQLTLSANDTGSHYPVFFVAGVDSLMWLNNHMVLTDNQTPTGDEIHSIKMYHTHHLTFQNSYFLFNGSTHQTVGDIDVHAWSFRDTADVVHWGQDTVLVANPYGGDFNTLSGNICAIGGLNHWSFDSCFVHTFQSPYNNSSPGGICDQAGIKNLSVKNTVWTHWGASLFHLPRLSGDTLTFSHNTLFATDGIIDQGGVSNFTPSPITMTDNIMVSRQNDELNTIIGIDTRNWNSGRVVADYNLYWQEFPSAANSNMNGTTGRRVESLYPAMYDLPSWLATYNGGGNYGQDTHSIQASPMFKDSTLTNVELIFNQYPTIGPIFNTYPLSSAAFTTASDSKPYLGAPKIGAATAVSGLLVASRTVDSTTVTWTAPAQAGQKTTSYYLYRTPYTGNPIALSGGVVLTPHTPNVAGTTETFTFATTDGTKYWFSIYAVDQWTNHSAVTYILVNTIPSKPSGGGGGIVERPAID